MFSFHGEVCHKGEKVTNKLIERFHVTSQDIISMPVAILVHRCIARPPLLLAKTLAGIGEQ